MEAKKKKNEGEDEQGIWSRKAIDVSGETERWMRKRREEKDRSEGWRITMGHVALLGLFGTSLSPVASGY